jgi:hypothetical protein
MAMECEPVDHECVAEQVEVLAVVADAVGAPEPECVVEVAVDRLGVVAAGVKAREVRVGGGDGSDVFGSVQLPCDVVGGAVESDSDDSRSEVLGESVVVVPAELPGLVSVAVGSDAGELRVAEVARFGELADPDGAAAGVELDGTSRPVPEGDGLCLEPGARSG